MSKLGIAIMSWQRPEYLVQCLASLAANDLTDVEVHLWQEGRFCRASGAEKTEPDKIAGNMAVFEASRLPDKVLHQQEKHMGYAQQCLTLMSYMAEHYDYWLRIEDDIICSRHMVTVMRTLLGQFKDDPAIGSVSAGFRLLCPPDEARDNRDKVGQWYWIDGRPGGNYGGTWLEGFWASKFANWWPMYEEYCQLISPWPYRAIAESEVRKLVADWAISKGSDMTEVSGDTAMIRAITMAGLRRVRCIVNRATNIGDYGLNCTPAILAEIGEGHQLIDESMDEPPVERFEELPR